jgi:ribosome-binding protein aMBF1 (putative translation factor)
MAVAVNEKGVRIGQGHQRAKVDDHDVDVIRELREEHGLTYRQLAEKYEVSKSLIRQICRYQIRCQTPFRWKIINVEDDA